MIYDGQRKQPYYECDKDNEREHQNRFGVARCKCRVNQFRSSPLAFQIEFLFDIFLLNWTTYVLFQFKVVGLFISLVHLLHDTKQISVLIYIYTVIIIYYYVNTNKIKFFLNQVLYDVEIYLYLKVWEYRSSKKMFLVTKQYLKTAELLLICAVIVYATIFLFSFTLNQFLDFV